MSGSQHPVDLNAVAAIIKDVAETEVLPRFQALAEHEIDEKRPGDLVTIADRAAEAALARRLAPLIPGALIVGEESHEDQPERLDSLGLADWAWLIDPVDGTHNFAHEIDRFAMIVGLCRRGETVAGWIYEPTTGQLALAESGGGATVGDKRVRLAGGVDTSEMKGSLGMRQAKRLNEARESGVAGIPGKFVRYRCVGLEYMDLARGILHFARYGGQLKPWDHAAGVLIHAEAGGYAALLPGQRRYTPGQPQDGRVLIMAPDKTSWGSLSNILAPR